MNTHSPSGAEADPFDLARFVSAQSGTYEQALRELQSGRKRSHWMWFIFPQCAGLGLSSTSQYYAIGSLEEADAYLNHPVLGPRLLACTRAVNEHTGKSAREIFGSPDDMKFRSSTTLFELVAGPASPFSLALDQYFAGERDARTLELIHRTPPPAAGS